MVSAVKGTELVSTDPAPESACEVGGGGELVNEVCGGGESAHEAGGGGK
jgi:hypothetical protein